MLRTFARGGVLVLSVVTANVALADATAESTSIKEFRTGTSLALQGDIRTALSHLNSVSPDALTLSQRNTWSCIRTRFRGKKPVSSTTDLDKWTAAVLAAYRDYWTRVMLKEINASVAGQQLAAKLARLAGEGISERVAEDMDAIESALETSIEARGYHALFGVTAPMREFMLWRKQTDQMYVVDLPAGQQTVHVVLLDDFISLGWAGYATCDYYHTAGWAKPDRLYAVRQAYDLDSESFRVSYLMHEGQHFSDYQHFPDMKQPDLEYRAKLVELSNAKSTLYGLLDAFAGNESASRETPHSWANRKLMTELADALLHGQAPSPVAWKSIAPADINAAAKRLFGLDTERWTAAAAAE
jgi:hypothetical protein